MSNKTSGWKIFGIAALIGGGIYAIMRIYNNYKISKEVEELKKKTELVTEDYEAMKSSGEFEKKLKEAAAKEVEKTKNSNSEEEEEEEEVEDIQNYLYPELDYKTASTDDLKKIFKRVNYVVTKDGLVNCTELIDLKTFDRYPAGKTAEEDPFDYDFFHGLLLKKIGGKFGKYIDLLSCYNIINPATKEQVTIYNPYPDVKPEIIH